MPPFLLKASQFCERLDRSLNHGQSLFLLVIRLYWGARFLLAGWGKLGNIESVAGYFDTLGIPLPMLNAYAASVTECLGGLLLLAGFASRVVCIPLIGTMVVALATAHRNEVKAIFASDPTTFLSALPITFLMAALTVLVFGPGRFSLDALVSRVCGSEQTEGRNSRVAPSAPTAVRGPAV